PFSFEGHGSPGRPTLYEYRPLVREFVESRADTIAALPDARAALQDLRREPAAAIFARAHSRSGARAGEDEALVTSVLLPLLQQTAEAAGGATWDDDAFERAYAELEQSLFGSRRLYAAVAPVVGLSLGAPADLGGGVRIRAAAAGELAAHRPDAAGLAPAGFGREPDRLCVLELEQELPVGEAEPPDAPAELADAVTALRLATAGPIAAGPVLFERLDWRPYGVRPVLPVAATAPPGEPVRLDAFRAGLAAELRRRLPLADDDRELGDALDRFELALFQDEPFRSEQLRASLVSLLGAGDGLYAATLRAAALLGESGRERAEVLGVLRSLGEGGAGGAALDAVRRALVETLVHGERPALVRALDEALLGVRPRPAAKLDLQAVAR
ncbi:MAG TPA: hypothetical protein VII62_03915, partial [Vicinamibacteria bacterium]